MCETNLLRVLGPGACSASTLDLALDLGQTVPGVDGPAFNGVLAWANADFRGAALGAGPGAGADLGAEPLGAGTGLGAGTVATAAFLALAEGESAGITPAGTLAKFSACCLSISTSSSSVSVS